MIDSYGEDEEFISRLYDFIETPLRFLLFLVKRWLTFTAWVSNDNKHCTGWSKKSRPTLKLYNFLSCYSWKKIDIPRCSLFTEETSDIKICENVNNDERHDMFKQAA